MQKIIFIVFNIIAPFAFGEFNTSCKLGYGPDATNITALINENRPSQIRLIGYSVLGSFSELNVTGCEDARMKDDALVCDGKVVGRVGPISHALRDGPYSGPRVYVELFEDSFTVAGDCDSYMKLWFF